MQARSFIGHSMGGLIAEKLLGQGIGVAGVAIDPAQIKFRFGFGNALSEEESAELYGKWAIPSPALPLFEAAVANFSLHSQAKINTGNQTRGPLLLISGAEDHTVPDVSTRSTLKQYRHSTAVTELRQFEHRGHSLTIDSGWKEVADAILRWLSEQGL
jgi:pimeloyl-ACP methyl ester carboxylesterase